MDVRACVRESARGSIRGNNIVGRGATLAYGTLRSGHAQHVQPFENVVFKEEKTNYKTNREVQSSLDIHVSATFVPCAFTIHGLL